MINGKKVIVATVMTNVIKNKYWPTSEHSLRSFVNTDYVDEVIVVDGMSTDDTASVHGVVSEKVKILKGPIWNTDDLSQENFIRQCNVAYDYCNSLNEDIFLVFECADVFFPDPFRIELKEVIQELDGSDKDFCVLPYAKMLTPWKLMMYSYKQTGNDFYNICVSKFLAKDPIWKEGLVHDGLVKSPPRPLRKLLRKWKSTAVSYETWHFDREQFKNKIKTHYNWDKNLTIDDTIQRMYSWKMKSFPVMNVDLEMHPVEATPILKHLKEDHLGWSLFGHIPAPVTYDDFMAKMGKQ